MLPHGAGVLRAGGAELSGHFVGGKLRGEGRGDYPDGEVYEAFHDDGVRSGEGTCRYADGAVYKGQWEGNLRQGAACSSCRTARCTTAASTAARRRARA